VYVYLRVVATGLTLLLGNESFHFRNSSSSNAHIPRYVIPNVMPRCTHLVHYQRSLRRGRRYIASFLVHFKLMQDARNEKIGLQPTPPGYALRPVRYTGSAQTVYTFALSIPPGNSLIVQL
jgi:hypothetical protein